MQFSISAAAHTNRDHDMLGKFRPFNYQATFVLSTSYFLPAEKNTITMTVNRRVQEKLFSSVKRTFIANFTGRGKKFPCENSDFRSHCFTR